MAECDPRPDPQKYGLRIRDVHALLKHGAKAYKRRVPNDANCPKNALHTIRYIILHHHAGPTTPTSGTNPQTKKSYQDTNGVPYALHATAKGFVDNKGWPGYAYDYDVGHYPDMDGNLSVVYQTQDLDLISNHTSAGKNDQGVGISMIGWKRNPGEPFGVGPLLGVPSEFQANAVQKLVQYLQDRFLVANSHIFGHFQYGKPSCPGWDMERWVIEREGRSFRCCYPVNLGPGSNSPLLAANGRDGQFSAYMKNTVQEGATGFYPYNRRRFWHNGVHLYPAGGKGSPVFAVRDGWIVAARVAGGDVKITEKVQGKEVERNYGSRCFVLVRHEEPGLRTPDKRTVRKVGKDSLLNHLHYYSLYMHLEKMEGGVPWLDLLEKCDKATYDNLVKSDKPVVFKDIALPVRTGEVIGKVGQHNPFAMRTQGSSKATELQALLHFEIFSVDNLLEGFDPDPKLSSKWLVTDDDVNPRVEERLRLPKTITALTSEIRQKIKDLSEKAEEDDPRCLEPDRVPQKDPDVNAVLSAMVCRHISEWETDWKSVMDEWKKKGKENNAQWRITDDQIAHHRAMVQSFQWLKGLDASSRRALALLVGGHKGSPKNTELYYHQSIRKNAKLYFYHPIRFLNWLNGLEKKLKVEMDYLNSGNPGKNPFPARVSAVSLAAKGSQALKVGPLGKQGLPEEFLNGAKILFKSGSGKGKKYRIEGAKKVLGSDKKPTKSREITLERPLEDAASAGDRVEIRHYDGEYGWAWKSRFRWDTRP